jgi:hypothetical protein
MKKSGAWSGHYHEQQMHLFQFPTFLNAGVDGKVLRKGFSDNFEGSIHVPCLRHAQEF